MADFNVADRVLELCKARSWSLYRLAHEADMPYSSLSTVLYKTASPSLVSIEKICSGFGICSPLTGVTSNSWDTPAGHRVYDACRGFSVSWVCRGSGASGVSSASC